MKALTMRKERSPSVPKLQAIRRKQHLQDRAERLVWRIIELFTEESRYRCD